MKMKVSMNDQKARKKALSTVVGCFEQSTMGGFTLLLVAFVCSLGVSCATGEFDVRQHLSTVTRYGVGKDLTSDSFVPTKIPDQCTPIHLNLVARHGTRAPTKKKMSDFDDLATRLEEMLRRAKEQNKSLDKIPGWMWKWESPWKGKTTDGELLPQGEDELYHLGVRIRQAFPELFQEDYHSDIYAIKATQVARSSASAVAFGMGLFSGKGNLGPGHHRSFAVITESRANDTVLRFHDCCQNYKGYKKSQELAVDDEHKKPVFDEVSSGLVGRYGLNFTPKDASSLWSLCQQEASLLNITSQACGLFTPHEVTLLEWTDDLEMFKLKAYGNSLNYRMGVPLLKDVVQSMEGAKNRTEGKVSGSYEKARMRIAHAETLCPFSCLLGLFLEKSESLPLPPKPPAKRNWRGNIVAPFAGNNILVLYSCPDVDSTNYFVRILHNEHPVPMPGCNNSDFCPFDVFKQEIVEPHLKHDFETLCSASEKQPAKQYPASSAHGSEL